MRASIPDELEDRSELAPVATSDLGVRRDLHAFGGEVPH
jgi:hypothetical protein